MQCKANDSISNERAATVVRVGMFLVWNAMQIAEEVPDFRRHLLYLFSGLQILRLRSDI
jgi:hypothetical protein